MQVKEFIEKAMEGGWRWKYFPGEDHKFRIQDEMNDKSGVVAVWESNESSFFIDLQDLLLDPLAWQAVGKAEGWDNKQHPHWRITLHREYDDPSKDITLKRIHTHEAQMHRMIDALVEGKTAVQFLETL